MTISVCIITKNEEECIRDALSSIKDLADEIILLDTGSKDKTVEIAKEFTSSIFYHPWDDNFAEARNISLKHATKDWILILDADEVIAQEDHTTIRELTKDPDVLAYSLRQINYTNDTSQFDYTPIPQKTAYTKEFKGFLSCNIIRLFKNHQNITFANPVHESVDASIPDKTKIKKTSIPIHHYQFQKENQKEKQLKYLQIYEEKIEEFANKAKVYRDMGIIYASFKQEYKKAIECFQKSLEHNPNNLKTYAGLIMCYHKLKKKEAALEIIQVMEKKFPQEQEVARMKQIILNM